MAEARQKMARRIHPGSGRRRGRDLPRGRQVDLQALVEVQALLGDQPRQRDLLIEFLHLLQDKYSCLHARHLAALAQEMKLALVEVYEVASFYAHFDIVMDDEAPPPPLTVRVCDSLTCELFGAQGLLKDLPAKLGDGVRVVRAPCMGGCHNAPVVALGHKLHESATLDNIAEAVAKRNTHPLPPSYPDLDAYRAQGGYALLGSCLAGKTPRDAVLKALEDAQLRGLGGAGFPTARKWRAVLAEPKPRLMAVNADEGEPGTFKDRYYMESDPHRFLEGALIGAWMVEAADTYIYLRDEYPQIRKLLLAEIDKLEAAGLARHTKIHLRRGAGAYICGEESAMLESIEGKRGLPRHKPPYPSQVGLFGRPTLINNVETLCVVPNIIDRGAAWFAGIGTKESAGTKLLSVAGDCSRPGIYEYPFGVSISKILEDAGAEDTQAVQVGGASGKMVGAKDFDRAISFEDLATGGSIMIFDGTRDLLEVVRTFTEFFVEENCGYCTPCRAGNRILLALLDRIISGHGSEDDLEKLKELGEKIKIGSRCGLGQTSPNPVLSTLESFRPIYERLLAKPTDGIRVSFDVEKALRESVEITGRRSTVL